MIPSCRRELDNNLEVSTETTPGSKASVRSAPPGCRGLREVTFERWTLTRSSYSNRIPRERSPAGRAGSPGDRDSKHSQSQRGKKRRRQKGPAELGGGERQSAPARPQAGTQQRDRCGRAEGGGYGPPRPGCTDRRPRRYPRPRLGPRPSAQPRPRLRRARVAHFPEFGELTHVAAASAGSTALSPGNPTWSLAAWLEPEPSAPGEGGRREQAGQ